MGLSFQQIALRAGLKSPAYVFHIENGHKVPSSDVAARLAGALEEDVAMFVAWARALQRGDLRSVLDAAGMLLDDPELAAFAAGSWIPRVVARTGAAAPPTFARLRVPVIPEAADPGDGVQPACEILRVLTLDAASLREPEALIRPFAYVLGTTSRMRVPDLAPDRVAILSRAPRPIDARCVFAVRTEARVELARVMWNGRSLLMLPAPGRNDFAVLDAPDEPALRARLLGFVAEVIAPSRLTP